VIVAGKTEHAAVFGRARGIAMAKHVTAAIDARTLAYQMPTTPSCRAPGDRLSCCEPQIAVAARSSFTPGWNLMPYCSRCFRAATSCWS